jgi:hypothetical protein
MLKFIKNLLSEKEESKSEVQSIKEEPKIEVIKKEINRESPKRAVKRKSSSQKPKKTEKEIATEKREPYVNILSVELDPENIGNGAFELDWNEYFIAKLIRSGYKGSDDAQIVDQWFQDVCRNVVLETFEQYEANNPRPFSGVQKKDIGAGRTEVS